MPVEELVAQALLLPPGERAELAHVLLLSLEPEEDEGEEPEDAPGREEG